jgi:hypothetical protein
MNTKHQATAASSFQLTEGIFLTLDEHEASGYGCIVLPADRRDILDAG